MTRSPSSVPTEVCELAADWVNDLGDHSGDQKNDPTSRTTVRHKRHSLYPCGSVYHRYLVRCEWHAECEFECHSLVAAVLRVRAHLECGHYAYVSHGDGTWLRPDERGLFGRMMSVLPRKIGIPREAV
jgi:hypothetical protein